MIGTFAYAVAQFVLADVAFYYSPARNYVIAMGIGMLVAFCILVLFFMTVYSFLIEVFEARARETVEMELREKSQHVSMDFPPSYTRA